MVLYRFNTKQVIQFCVAVCILERQGIDCCCLHIPSVSGWQYYCSCSEGFWIYEGFIESHCTLGCSSVCRKLKHFVMSRGPFSLPRRGLHSIAFPELHLDDCCNCWDYCTFFDYFFVWLLTKYFFCSCFVISLTKTVQFWWREYC